MGGTSGCMRPNQYRVGKRRREGGRVGVVLSSIGWSLPWARSADGDWLDLNEKPSIYELFDGYKTISDRLAVRRYPRADLRMLKSILEKSTTGALELEAAFSWVSTYRRAVKEDLRHWRSKCRSIAMANSLTKIGRSVVKLRDAYIWTGKSLQWGSMGLFGRRGH